MQGLLTQRVYELVIQILEMSFFFYGVATVA